MKNEVAFVQGRGKGRYGFCGSVQSAPAVELGGEAWVGQCTCKYQKAKKRSSKKHRHANAVYVLMFQAEITNKFSLITPIFLYD
jgi:hypothetical protein